MKVRQILAKGLSCYKAENIFLAYIEFAKNELKLDSLPKINPRFGGK